MLLTRPTRLTTLTIAVVLFAVLSSLTTECQAQRRRFVPGQELGRFLGVFQGPGFHCNNPGQNTNYYNPYSAHNSRVIYPNEPRRVGSGYSLFDADSVPHSSYTGRDSRQHSVFESLPGQSVQPSFEPAVDRTKKGGQDADSDSGLDFDADSDFDNDSDFESDSAFDSDFDEPSTVKSSNGSGSKGTDSDDMASDDEGGFDTLKESFDDIQGENKLPPNPDAFGEDSFLE